MLYAVLDQLFDQLRIVIMDLSAVTDCIPIFVLPDTVILEHRIKLLL